MAAKTADVIISAEVRLKSEDVKELAKLWDEPGLTDTQKVQQVVRDLVEDRVGGGIMMTGEEVQLIRESTGLDMDNGIADILPFLSEKAGMQDGFHRVTVLIDPANYPAYEELARTQERTVDEIMQEVVNMVQENEWVYELHPRPRQVIMTEADAKQLEELLEGKFQTGTELVALFRKAMAPVSLFEEAEQSNVGQEA